MKQARAAKNQAEALAKRAEATTALEEARSLVGSDALAAHARLQRARSLDPELEGLSETANLIAAQARGQGEAALLSAKNLDRVGRPEALKDYERAAGLFELLPSEHPELALARQRIAVLKGGK